MPSSLLVRHVNPRDGTENKGQEDDYRPYRYKRHETKTTYRFTVAIRSMKRYTAFSLTLSLRISVHLALTWELRRSATTYQANVWDWSIPQPQVKCVMTIIYQTLMMQKQLCLHTSAMTWNYISIVTLELEMTTSYHPNTRWTLRSHRRYRQAFKCICRMKCLWGSCGWTTRSASNC